MVSISKVVAQVLVQSTEYISVVSLFWESGLPSHCCHNIAGASAGVISCSCLWSFVPSTVRVPWQSAGEGAGGAAVRVSFGGSLVRVECLYKCPVRYGTPRACCLDRKVTSRRLPPRAVLPTLQVQDAPSVSTWSLSVSCIMYHALLYVLARH
ncbi:hypothetical protein HDV62DRAFT_245742 [Trichoderma sp. SZMC 28011]